MASMEQQSPAGVTKASLPSPPLQIRDNDTAPVAGTSVYGQREEDVEGIQEGRDEKMSGYHDRQPVVYYQHQIPANTPPPHLAFQSAPPQSYTTRQPLQQSNQQHQQQQQQPPSNYLYTSVPLPARGHHVYHQQPQPVPSQPPLYYYDVASSQQPHNGQHHLHPAYSNGRPPAFVDTPSNTSSSALGSRGGKTTKLEPTSPVVPLNALPPTEASTAPVAVRTSAKASSSSTRPKKAKRSTSNAAPTMSGATPAALIAELGYDPNPPTSTEVFPCPHCTKEYRGKHARSIWRRHLSDKHGIPLSSQPRRTRWDSDNNRPKSEEERRARMLHSKRKWASKHRETSRSEPPEEDEDDEDEDEDELPEYAGGPSQSRAPKEEPQFVVPPVSNTVAKATSNPVKRPGSSRRSSSSASSSKTIYTEGAATSKMHAEADTTPEVVNRLQEMPPHPEEEEHDYTGPSSRHPLKKKDVNLASSHVQSLGIKYPEYNNLSTTMKPVSKLQQKVPTSSLDTVFLTGPHKEYTFIQEKPFELPPPLPRRKSTNGLTASGAGHDDPSKQSVASSSSMGDAPSSKLSRKAKVNTSMPPPQLPNKKPQSTFEDILEDDREISNEFESEDDETPAMRRGQASRHRMHVDPALEDEEDVSIRRNTIKPDLVFSSPPRVHSSPIQSRPSRFSGQPTPSPTSSSAGDGADYEGIATSTPDLIMGGATTDGQSSSSGSLIRHFRGYDGGILPPPSSILGSSSFHRVSSGLSLLPTPFKPSATLVPSSASSSRTPFRLNSSISLLPSPYTGAGAGNSLNPSSYGTGNGATTMVSSCRTPFRSYSSHGVGLGSSPPLHQLSSPQSLALTRSLGLAPETPSGSSSWHSSLMSHTPDFAAVGSGVPGVTNRRSSWFSTTIVAAEKRKFEEDDDDDESHQEKGEKSSRKELLDRKSTTGTFSGNALWSAIGEDDGLLSLSSPEKQ